MKKYFELLAARLPEGRFRHSLGVADTAAGLAVKNGIDPEQARLAGLLHDYARDLPPGRLLELAEEAGLISCEIERRLPLLLHGPVGALLLERELGITDKAVLQAVARHTVGAPAMTPLDKIIYLADVIEPGRQFAGVHTLRQAAVADLDTAFLKALEATIVYVLDREQLLHPATVEARNFILMTRGG